MFIQIVLVYRLQENNLKILLPYAILNSNRIFVISIKLSVCSHLGQGKYCCDQEFILNNSPIPPITLQNQLIVQQIESIESIVDKILTLTQDPTYDTDPQKQAQVKSLKNKLTSWFINYMT